MANRLLTILALAACVVSAAHRVPPTPAGPEYTSEGPAPCPCANPEHCKPVKKPNRKEVFAFQTNRSNWVTYNWTHITTIVLYNGLSQEMYCLAHALGVRLIWATGYSASQLLNQTAVSIYLQQERARLQNTLVDGINIDFEDPVAPGSAEEAALTNLVAGLRDVVRSTVPGGGQITFDVAWSPKDIDKRAYDYASIVHLCDFVVIMDYDTRSQVFGTSQCLAGANAPAKTMIDGVKGFLALNQNPKKLVLGVPWYGYVYTCLNTTDPTVETCHIASVPFRGCNCSDAAGYEVSISSLMGWYNGEKNVTTQLVTDTTPRGDGLWARFNFVDSNGIHQVWLDTPDVLAQKYAYAKQKHLRGISMWNIDCLSTNPLDPTTVQMWQAMDSFF